MLYKDYIINPDPYLLPYYKLSPFNNSAISLNKKLPESGECDNFFKMRYPNSFLNYTRNGRSALNLALVDLDLKSGDLVTIITTTQNFYISGCVTQEVEKFCKWNREITNETKVILINHEFGYPCKQILNLKKYNLPIIEDCAYAFDSQNEDNLIGKLGDYVIFSFPKFFPIQIGGLIISKHDITYPQNIIEINYIKKVISNHIPNVDLFSAKRIENYTYLLNEFEKIGIKSRFGLLEKGTIPGVFMLILPEQIGAPMVKEFMCQNGVECSVFYPENTLFIPCHHYLNQSDLNYFITLIDYYVNNNL